MKPKKPHIPDFRKIARVLKSTAQQVAEERVQVFADEECEAFKKRIEAQDFPAFDAIPLSSKYRAQKIRMGLDPRTMIRTGHYKDAIKVFSRKNKDGSTTYRVGFHPRAMAVDAKGKRIPFLLKYLAAVQEKGSVKARVPARPHWGPHRADMHKRAPMTRMAIRKAIIKQARKKLAGVF